MTTSTLPDVTAPRDLIGPWILRTIGARDLMITGEVTSFFFGPVAARPVRRAEIRRTSENTFELEIGHIDVRSHEWVVDQTKPEVQADTLRDTIRELT